MHHQVLDGKIVQCHCASVASVIHDDDETNNIRDPITAELKCPECLIDTAAYAALVEAAELFCKRVEMGEIRSKHSYSAFKNILNQRSK